MISKLDEKLIELAGENAIGVNNQNTQRTLKCLKYLTTQLKIIANRDKEQVERINGILEGAHNILFSEKQ